MGIDWKAHYAEYTWATENMNAPVKVQGDSRKWFYTAKKIHKGVMHARLVSTPDWTYLVHRKKLVPMDKVTFL